MTEIIRGTTPTFEFTFSLIKPEEIVTAYLVIKQNGKEKISIPLSEATVSESSLAWTLSQEESLSLAIGRMTDVHCDWVTTDGTRGSSKTLFCEVHPGGKEEVI